LLFVASANEVRAARRVDPGESGGLYVDTFATAVQRFDAEKMENENGFFGLLGIGLGRILTFKGPFKWPDSARRATCAFQSTTLCLGPFELPIGEAENFDQLPLRDLAFFNFVLVDDVVSVALGRSGGLAIWVRTTADFDREHMKV